MALEAAAKIVQGSVRPEGWNVHERDPRKVQWRGDEGVEGGGGGGGRARVVYVFADPFNVFMCLVQRHGLRCVARLPLWRSASLERRSPGAPRTSALTSLTPIRSPRSPLKQQRSHPHNR